MSTDVKMSYHLDLTMSCDSWESNAPYDIVPKPLPGDHLNPIACYLGEHMEKYLTHPYASPLFGDFTGLPPLLIQSGEAEVLRDESTLMAHKATLAGVTVRHELYEDAVSFLVVIPDNDILTGSVGSFACFRCMYFRHSRSSNRLSKRSTRLGSLYVKRSNHPIRSRLHISRATLKNNSRTKLTMRRLRLYRATAQFPLREKKNYATLRKLTRKCTPHLCMGMKTLSHTLTPKDTRVRTTMTISPVGYRKPHGLPRHSLPATKSVSSSRAVIPHTHTVEAAGSEVGRLRLRASPVRFCACRLYPRQKYHSPRRPYHRPQRTHTLVLCHLQCVVHAHART